MATAVATRLATMGDYDAICRLLKQVDQHHVEILPNVFKSFDGPARPRELIASHVEASDAAYILAEMDSKLVGFVNLKKAAHPNYPMFKPHEFALIENLVVDEAHRRKGVGTILFEEARKWALARDLKHIQLTVWVANAPATAFYAKLGFKPIHARMELPL
jgi:ribosomal protein S18 acetylase RimI-like enzyme